jgi:signal transduction histidine kinase
LAIAHQAALAISNARLHVQVQRAAVLEERYRLSREMHDGLAQTLSALGWQMDRMKVLLSGGRLGELEDEVRISRWESAGWSLLFWGLENGDWRLEIGASVRWSGG